MRGLQLLLVGVPIICFRCIWW